ncbi:MAG: isoprenylcysteine carboxylmethyltransferase family protein [Candidatus Marinimicrobia bacterium]|nr:isoprenylcysteine carboxylmethyltransferase family protein [Candidatus Neomarinimicrobiota bacterium]
MIQHISTGLGVIILIVSAITGGILLLSPGSIRLQRPDCGWAGWLFNILNLLFFLIMIPICGIIMIKQVQMPYFICLPALEYGGYLWVELLGISIFLIGSILLFWSRISLRRSFRLAGVKPSQSDYLTLHGPYKLIRHPMYLAALVVLFGLTLILASALLATMFIIMLFLIIKLIPQEEIQLDQAYPIAYMEYCRRVPHALFPFRHGK